MGRVEKIGISQQKWKSKLLNKIFFAAVILCNFLCLDCQLYKPKAKDSDIVRFLFGNYSKGEEQHGDIIANISNPPGSSAKYYKQKGMMDRSSDLLPGKPTGALSRKYDFQGDAHDSSINAVGNSLGNVKKVVQRRPDFLTTNTNDIARGPTNYAAVEEKVACELSTDEIIKMPIFSRSNSAALEKNEQSACQEHVSISISKGQAKEANWTTELVWDSEENFRAIATKQQFSGTAPLLTVAYNQDESEQEKDAKSIFLNRLTKELKEEEDETLPFEEASTIAKDTRDSSTQNDMNSSFFGSEESLANIMKEVAEVQRESHNFTEDNQEQTNFSSDIFSDTNDINASTINASRFSDSGNSLIDGNKENEILSVIEILYAKFPVQVWKSVGLFDDSYIENGIDPHWMGFEPPNPIIHDTLAGLYAIIMTVGCSGNFLVVYMFARCRSLRTPANYLIANLAISDFLMLAKMPIFIFNSIYRGPALGSIGCQIYGFVGGLTGTASIMTLTAIARERYYAIVHPLNPFKRTSTRTILMITTIWIYSGVFSMIPLLGLNGYVSEGYLTSCSFNYLSKDNGSRIFVFVFFLAAWLFPLSVIVFSYVQIIRIVQEAEKMNAYRNKDGPHKESFKYKKNESKLRTEIKIAIISSGVIALWILSWSPYAIVALLGIFGKKKYITPIVSAVPALFCKTASCIDPFVYSISHPRFQRELKAKFNVCIPSGRNFSTRSCRDNSFVTASCHASLSPQVSVSDNLVSSTVQCGPVSLKTNCPCRERSQNRKSKTLALLKARKINKEGVLREEIEMRQVRLQRFSEDTKTKIIEVEFPHQACNEILLEDTVGEHIEESSESGCCQSEQQEIILHVCSTHPSSCGSENDNSDLMTDRNKSKENSGNADPEDNNQADEIATTAPASV